MTQGPNDGYFVEIRETLVGRKAGGSAAEKARELRAANRLGTRVARVLGMRTDERAWRVGAHGEMLNGRLLKRLPTGWHVINDIPVGERGANIDHVVVGPGGVFTVNTKNLTGKVWLSPRVLLHNGHKTNYIPQASNEARRASRLLTAALGRQVEVRGVLAILADDWDIKEKPSDVYVGSLRGVKRWLLELPEILSARQVNEITGAAAKPSTWTDKRPRGKVASPDPRVASAVPVAPAVEQPAANVARVCTCGGAMVPRRRRSDGVEFLGCSRYPKCRRTWPLPD